MSSVKWLQVMRVASVAALVSVAVGAAGCSEDSSTAQCVVDQDCERFTICQGALCASVACLSDADCGPGQICAVTPGGDTFCSAVECGDDQPCPEGEICVSQFCEPAAAKECVELEGTCMFDGDCCEDTVCGDDGICIEFSGCATDDDCPEGTCDVKTGECLDDTVEPETCPTVACPEGQVCDEASGQCLDSVGGGGECQPCTADSDCGANGACFALGGAEYCLNACVDNGQCPTGYKCFPVPPENELHCVPGGYDCSLDCVQNGCADNEACDFATGECVPKLSSCDSCQKDDHCGTGSRCVLMTATEKVCMPECDASGACIEGGICQEVDEVAVCKPSSDVCCYGPDCDVQGDCGTCPADKPYCLNSTCVNCIYDSHCEDGEICNQDTNSCVSATSPEGCNPPCSAPTPICKPQTLTCVECLTSSDCGDGTFCDPAANVCTSDVCGACQDPYPACVEINGQMACVQCVQDSDCPSGECDEATYFCEGGGSGTTPASCKCTSDADCPTGTQFTLKCDTSAGTCYDVAGGCDNISACCDAESGSECVSIFDLMGGGGGLPAGGLPGLPGGAFGLCTCSAFGGLGDIFGTGGGESSGTCLGGLECSPIGLFLGLLGGTADPNAEFSDSSFCE